MEKSKTDIAADGEPLVFIVDDEAFNRDIASRFVRKMGLQTKEFSSGAAVMEALSQGLPDLMLLDIHMPGMNGLEVLGKVREFSSKLDFPILMVTADSNPDSVVEAFDLGANDYVTKPIDSRTLRARIETHHHLSTANRQNREFAEGAEQVIADREVELQKRNQDLVREVNLRMTIEEELREAKTRVEAENRAKSEFLAVMTHELITPLHVSLGFSDLIAGDDETADSQKQYKEYASHISNSMRQLLMIVKDMLVLAKHDVGKLSVSDSEVDLRSIVEQAVETARPDDEKTSVQVNVECDGSIELLADRVLLGRALSSVISNAVKFSHEDGVCDIVCATREDGGVRIDIRDEGIGFDTDKLTDVLKPFRQSSEGLGRKYQGIGIGLPLAKAVFDQHGVEMSFDSKQGVGTTVKLDFPSYRTLSCNQTKIQQAAG
ncbi:MAG: hybrid sensor histidine kinase/response regulator [Pseudomonadota bacterium]